LCLFAFVAIASWESGGSFVVKNNCRSKFVEARQRFRLTPTEKRVALFVLAAFVLGLAAKWYRECAFLPYPGDMENRGSKLRKDDKGQTCLPKAD
jgi:hypothetical protein